MLDGALGKDTEAAKLGSHHRCLSSEPYCKDPKPAQTEMLLLQHGLYAEEPVSKVLLIPHTGMFLKLQHGLMIS
jgi:hypothetical protein